MKYFVCILAGNDLMLYLKRFDVNTGKPVWSNKEEANGYTSLLIAHTALGNCRDYSCFIYGEKE